MIIFNGQEELLEIVVKRTMRTNMNNFGILLDDLLQRLIIDGLLLDDELLARLLQPILKAIVLTLQIQRILNRHNLSIFAFPYNRISIEICHIQNSLRFPDFLRGPFKEVGYGGRAGFH